MAALFLCRFRGVRTPRLDQAAWLRAKVKWVNSGTVTKLAPTLSEFAIIRTEFGDRPRINPATVNRGETPPAVISYQTGRSIRFQNNSSLNLADHPVRSRQGCFAIFLWSRPPRLIQAGSSLA
jgi:hypothetical protein